MRDSMTIKYLLRVRCFESEWLMISLESQGLVLGLGLATRALRQLMTQQVWVYSCNCVYSQEQSSQSRKAPCRTRWLQKHHARSSDDNLLANLHGICECLLARHAILWQGIISFPCSFVYLRSFATCTCLQSPQSLQSRRVEPLNCGLSFGFWCIWSCESEFPLLCQSPHTILWMCFLRSALWVPFEHLSMNFMLTISSISLKEYAMLLSNYLMADRNVGTLLRIAPFYPRHCALRWFFWNRTYISHSLQCWSGFLIRFFLSTNSQISEVRSAVLEGRITRTMFQRCKDEVKPRHLSKNWSQVMDLLRRNYWHAFQESLAFQSIRVLLNSKIGVEEGRASSPSNPSPASSSPQKIDKSNGFASRSKPIPVPILPKTRKRASSESPDNLRGGVQSEPNSPIEMNIFESGRFFLLWY